MDLMWIGPLLITEFCAIFASHLAIMLLITFVLPLMLDDAFAEELASRLIAFKLALMVRLFTNMFIKVPSFELAALSFFANKAFLITRVRRPPTVMLLVDRLI